MASITPINSSSQLGRKNAAHLLRRLTFGPTRKEIDEFSNYTLDQALGILLAVPTGQPAPPIHPSTGLPWVNKLGSNADDEEGELQQFVCGWWVYRMISSRPSILERMVWFMHTHFTTIRSRVENSSFLYNQNALYRYYALGNIKELAKKVCYDNAMLRNLDGRLNVKGSPQENFGREFLELYTIGKGEQKGPDDYTNYTEQDVKAATLVFTGYDTNYNFDDPTYIDQVTGLPMGKPKGSAINASQHDDSDKVFSAAFGNKVISTPNAGGVITFDDMLQELQELVDMIFDQGATARYLCRRLYRMFVYYDITDEIENNIIAPMAKTMMDNSYELLPVLGQLFRSAHFFDMDTPVEDDDNFGAIIKSPLEVTIGTLRFFNVSLPDYQSNTAFHYEALASIVFEKLKEQGLNFYEPFDVVGYDAYHQFPGFNRNWITSNNLAYRYKFSETLLKGARNVDNELLFQADILKFATDEGIDVSSPDKIVSYFVDYLLPEEITQERFDYFKSKLLIDVQEKFWVDTVSSQPDKFILVYHLEGLITAIIQSPEYQLY